ncbi:MAG: site-specific DNA-methyltransferase [Corallococcus sp.]|nr:site-specific DNA-methyltransferase [Corallococcus sp.]
MTDYTKFYNCDCVRGAKEYLQDNSVDLIVCDPPYGIKGNELDKHYNRNEDKVIEGYIDVPAENYASFSLSWIKEAERVLKPGGSMYILSGYTNLRHILNALAETELEEINHIIWKYNFGVYTKQKYVSSHYHILYYTKTGGKRTFNTYAFFDDDEKTSNGGSKNYLDREDVWVINKEYKPNQIKNKNELPEALLRKIIMYSSNPDDMVCDFFLGSFSTARVAAKLGRQSCGFELNKASFDYYLTELKKITYGCEMTQVKSDNGVPQNRGKKISDDERQSIIASYNKKIEFGNTKKQVIDELAKEFSRGYWSIIRILEKENINKS